MDSGRLPSRFRESMRSTMVLDTFVRSLKSSLDRKGPSFTASTMASAALSPRPSMLFREGISFPSTIWKDLDWAVKMSMGANSNPLACISCTMRMSP